MKNIHTQYNSYEFIHYTKAEVAAIDLTRTYTQTAKNLVVHKPNGLWLSIVGISDWENYCIKTETDLEKLKSEFQIMLKPDAKILYLYNNDVFQKFLKKYGYYAEGIVEHNVNDTPELSIRWERIIANYQGIVVSIVMPYLHNIGSWRYTWCCTSACIWDLQAVERAIKLC